jgi:hypothetical protein
MKYIFSILLAINTIDLIYCEEAREVKRFTGEIHDPFGFYTDFYSREIIAIILILIISGIVISQVMATKVKRKRNDCLNDHEKSNKSLKGRM